MSKTKESISKIVKFFREIVVIVIGVAITLSASYFITKISEKKDMYLYLNAIKMELEENIGFFEEEVLFLEDWENYAHYLSSRDKKLLHTDSIRRWGYSGLGTIHNVTFQTSAFEMFKVSGAMRLINDKELLQSLWKSYIRLENSKIALDSYYQLKKEECIKSNQLELAGKSDPIPLYDFFYSYAGFGALDVCKGSLQGLKETVEKLEKTLKNM